MTNFSTAQQWNRRQDRHRRHRQHEFRHFQRPPHPRRLLHHRRHRRRRQRHHHHRHHRRHGHRRHRHHDHCHRRLCRHRPSSPRSSSTAASRKLYWSARSNPTVGSCICSPQRKRCKGRSLTTGGIRRGAGWTWHARALRSLRCPSTPTVGRHAWDFRTCRLEGLCSSILMA